MWFLGDLIEKAILRLKLQFWWKYTIEEDEFSPELDLFAIGDVKQLLYKRELAHQLDSGVSYKKINLDLIRKAGF